MSPVQTRLNVAARLDEQAQMLDRQRQNLGSLCAKGVPGAWQVLDAIYGEEPALQCGSAPRLREVRR